MDGRYVSQMLFAGIDWLIPARARGGDADMFHRARLVVTFCSTLILAAIIYSAVLFSMNSAIGGAALDVGVGGGVCVLWVMRRTGSCFAAGNLLAASFFAVLTALACRLGGLGAPSLFWYAAVPVTALSTAGRRSAAFWLAVTLSSLVAFYALDFRGYSFPNDLAPHYIKLLDLLGSIGLIVLMLGLTRLYETAKKQTLAELKSKEDCLLQEKGFSNSAIASLPGIFYLFDNEGRLVRWNENFERVSGYSAKELATMRPLDFFRGRDREAIEQSVEDVFAQGQASQEACLVSKHGTAIPHVFSGKRIMIGGRPHLVGMGFDITDRKRAEEQLRESCTELERFNRLMASTNKALEESAASAEVANRAKSAFLANMSHEIRTPMTAILGFSEVLLASRTDQDQLEAVTTIKRNGEHLLNLINDILDLSKIEAGKLDVERIQCSPCQVLSEVVSLMRVRATAKNLSLEIEYKRPIPESIQSDSTRLRQILINLIGNAIKFTEVGGVRLVACLLDADSDEAKMQFEVVDSGIGMTEEQIGRLFNPFSQLDTSATRKYGGTGLGLTISKRLAERLGGSVTVTSTPGEGSTFTVTVTTGPLDVVRLLDNPTEAQVSTALENKPNEFNSRLDCRVLLAEDGPDNQRLIAFLLKKAGAEVTLAENGQIAHALAQAAQDEGTPFDVILMDMQMPVMDGYDATGKLREAGYAGPIIALTAHAMNADRDKCLNAGCDDYATKPIDRKKLLATVAHWAARGRTNDDSPKPTTSESNAGAPVRTAFVHSHLAADPAGPGRPQD